MAKHISIFWGHADEEVSTALCRGSLTLPCYAPASIESALTIACPRKKNLYLILHSYQ